MNRSDLIKTKLNTVERLMLTRDAEDKAKKWRKRHKAGIAAYNKFTHQYGCFGDEYRVF